MATMHWGRKETIIFPPHGAVYTYGAVFFALILTGLFVYLRFTFGNTPLQRFYTPIYIRSSVAGGVSASRKDKYRLVMIGARGIRPRPATDADVTDGNTPEPGTKPLPLALSQSALQAGYDLLYQDPERTYIDAPLSGYLKSAIYGGDSLFDIYQLPLFFGLLSLLIQLPFSIRKDIKRRKQMRYGRRLKGTERVTPKEFNCKVQGEGIGIKIDGLKEMLRIPAKAEAQHVQIIADTGGGKTTIIMQMLRQIRSRGDSAIVYDPALEYTRRFYDPKTRHHSQSARPAMPLLGTSRRVAHKFRSGRNCRLAVPAPARQKGRVLFRDSAADLRLSAALWADPGGAYRMDE